MFSRFHAPLTVEGQSRNLSRLGAAMVLSLASSFSCAQSAGLTLDQALQQATQRSASNQASVAAIEASRESAAKADQLPDPMLKLGVDNLPVNGPDRLSLTHDFMTMRRVGIEQQWVSSDKRVARSERAQRAVEMEEANHLANIAKVREETAKAWVAVWYAQRTTSLTRMLETEAKADLETQQAAYRGAKSGAMDAAQAQLTLVQVQDVARKSEQELRTARAVLGRWVLAPVESVDNALPSLVSHVAKLAVEDLEKYHPMVMMAKRAVTLADAETTVASRERRPDWSVEASYSQRGGQYSNMVSVGVSIPLTVNPSQRQDRDIAEKSALATKARLQYEEALRELQNEIQTLSFTLTSLNERVAALREQLLPLANQQVELATAAYRAGTGSLSAVFNAKKMLVEKQLQIAELEKDAAMTWASLEYHVVPHNMPTPGRSAQ
ncbi:TolC family protein [Herbaspirillum sp. GCM10030257]|uniref:TolC family protein n=1 Tax=Herbaspirillum sp. GCM10030257 TaxID=3273393 RepID=UPI003618A988